MTFADLHERLNLALGQKYQILCHLGGGGMSQVFLARHRFHGGLAAVKVLAEHLAQDSNIVGRFQREARMTASLGNHPNIVPVFDIGEGNGLYFLVMQFIPGEDLASFLKREGRLPLAQAGNVIAQVAEALSCAESKRIVHRDLKPANMLLDNNGRIRLLDFGISRITDLSDGLTRPGESMGTPYYMSPEQIRGETCDIRSDLYSLGIVFFEILTGKRPFENDSTIGIQMAHLNSAPPSLLTVAPELPAECDTIIQKLIAKRPEDRYQNTAELLAVLVARGASPNAGDLRPVVALTLSEVIARAEELPLDLHSATAMAQNGHASTPPASATVPTPPSGAAPTPILEKPPAQPPSSTSTAVSKKTEARSDPPQQGSKLKFGLVLVALVLLGLIGTAAWLLRARQSAASRQADSGQSASTAPIFSDDHGRMVLVSEGSSQFNKGLDRPAQAISLPAFYIDETEVSNAQYHRFCESTGRTPPPGFDFATHPDFPVGNVSYEEASAYATWAGRRLPTEEEWEKAARGTDGRSYPWGNAPWIDNVPTQIQPVNSEPSRKSPYGAYNMAGNVWEWTATPYSPVSTDLEGIRRLVKNQSFSSDWRTIKGGSYASGSREEFNVARFRGLPINLRSVWVGFRCVRSVP